MPLGNLPASTQALASLGYGIMVSRSGEVAATTTTKNLFIANGPVLFCGATGVVSVVMDAAATTALLWIGANGATNISTASASLANLAVGAFAFPTGVFATATQVIGVATAVTSVSAGHGTVINHVFWPSGLNLGVTYATGQTTGQIQWNVWYLPLSPTSTVTSV